LNKYKAFVIKNNATISGFLAAAGKKSGFSNLKNNKKLSIFFIAGIRFNTNIDILKQLKKHI
jgi:hypothetical protein